MPKQDLTVGAKDKGEISDGYHTFNELYEQRSELLIVLLKQNYGQAWRSREHDDGSKFDGYFIVGLKLPEGDVTYHLQDSYWDRLNGMVTLEKAEVFDGHTPKDALKRLKKWSSRL